MDAEQLEALRAGMSAPFPFVERTGFEVLEVRPGYCRARMPLAPNINHIGTMYAGALYTLAELPGGVLALATFDPARYYPVVKDMRIRFTARATTDIDVAVSLDEAEIARIRTLADEHGKADYAWDCQLTDVEGTVVATTENHYQLRAHGS